jgi:hypothetical protein
MHLAALTSLSETLDITSEALAAAKFTATSDALANLTVLHGAALVGLEAVSNAGVSLSSPVIYYVSY